MEFKELISDINKSSQVKELKKILKKKGCGKIHCRGVAGSYMPLLISTILNKLDRDLIIILNDREEASYFFDDLNRLHMGSNTLFFPSSCKRSLDFSNIDGDNVILRTEALNRLSQKDDYAIVVTHLDAVVERVISSSDLKQNTLLISQGDNIGIELIEETLLEFNFERVDFVYEPGTYSIRGSIVDIFSYSHEEPYRVDFFDDDVESIRVFDIETQASTKDIDKISIIPNMQEAIKRCAPVSIFDFVNKSTLIVSPNLSGVKEIIKQATEKLNDSDIVNIISKDKILNSLNSSPSIEYGLLNLFTPDTTVQFNISPQPLFHKNFDLLGEDLERHKNDNYKSLIISSNDKQLDRIEAIFNDKGIPHRFNRLDLTLSSGFIDHDSKVCCYTDHQIFERYHRFKVRANKSAKSTITLKELNKLHPGDYVVHIDHGVGKFVGLVKSTTNGKVQESIRLVFKDNDSLLVSIHSLHRISKFKGKDGSEPKINKLGSPAWQNLKNKAKKKVKDIAKDLIALYAKRKEQSGFQYSEDTYMQQELEASFIYEDTPDQTKSTAAVKLDMEKPTPMDRLVCGDVGFGKTEIAIRAAFKAVADNKQVAILVPTTILALQHYKTFCSRLKDMPCNIEYISRLRKSADVKQVLTDLKSGKIDIIIGTHKLVGKSVEFYDLGLLIIDEEQKFGVSIKEKLKNLKIDVDTLTLTATPIPRTLQFSLMGARDLSVINTPPPNRYPIVTEVHGFNEDVIREAINYEMDRGGQVFFINNRVQNIKEVEDMIRRVVPKAKTVVGHGQMDGPKLEGVLLDFINGDYDVLIATTIIESGLDIPNANTIIINNAQNFGLSELHQLRGRVGRTNKKAFCYLLAPPLSALPTEGRRRLEAIEQFSELGSGFSIAMQDLDIRGAGNILGAEQSGFIADIGFETYHRILNEAIQELKSGEYQGVFDEKESDEASKAFLKVNYISDCQIETDLEMRFPEYYVESTPERMQLYRELDSIENREKIDIFLNSLRDRFGEPPAAVLELIEMIKLRWIAVDLNMERVILKNGKMRCYFISDSQSEFYSSSRFSSIITWIQKNPQKVTIQESSKLSMIFKNIGTVSKGYKTILNLQKEVE